MIAKNTIIHGEVPNTCVIWDFSKVMKTAQIEDYVTIGSFCEIAGKVGRCTKIQNGVYVWEGVEIGENCFIGPNVTFTNVKLPNIVYKQKYQRTVIGKGTMIGANATILCGITIGENCIIGAGSVVTKSIPDNAVVYGNPAKQVNLKQDRDDYYEIQSERGNL